MEQLQIVEIMGRAKQGVSRPYICKASDDHIYFVKGGNTDRQSLFNEYICGSLAQFFGIPLPAFELLFIEDRFLWAVPSELKGIGQGFVFGSKQYVGEEWLEQHQIKRIGLEVKRDILVFDRWIQNMDRTLGDGGSGNSNLIFNTKDDCLVVIDHNLAFDPKFDFGLFLEDHIFRELWDNIDMLERLEYQKRFAKALLGVQNIWCKIPEEWKWANPERDVPATIIAPLEINRILSQYENSDFWHR